MRKTTFALALGAVLGCAGSASATVAITVDLSGQRLHASDGRVSYTWPISSGGDGYATPDGAFRPQRLIADAHSNLYANAPMPHAIFFYGPYAIHGTYETRFLGHPVSHGCVRLPPAAAATLFALVKKEGAAIRIEGAAPKGWHVYGKKSPVGPMAKLERKVAPRIEAKHLAPRTAPIRARLVKLPRPPAPALVYYGDAPAYRTATGGYRPPAYRPGLVGWMFGDSP